MRTENEAPNTAADAQAVADALETKLQVAKGLVAKLKSEEEKAAKKKADEVASQASAAAAAAEAAQEATAATTKAAEAAKANAAAKEETAAAPQRGDDQELKRARCSVSSLVCSPVSPVCCCAPLTHPCLWRRRRASRRWWC